MRTYTRAGQRRNRCRRCGGALVEIYADLLSPSESGEEVRWWHCVNCGDYVDRQIIPNRLEQGQAVEATFS